MSDFNLSFRPRLPPLGLSDMGRLVRLAAPPLIAASLLVGGWHLVSAAGLVTPRLLPSPATVFDTLVRSVPTLLEQAEPTFWGAVAGIVVAAALGISLGIAVSFSPTAMQAVYPTIVFFQLIPKVALAPVFLIWFGTGLTANIVFSVFIAFFPVLVATITGLRACPTTCDALCQSFGMRRWHIFLSVKLPYALPYIFSGLRIGVTFSVIGIVLGEFITAQRGLGYIILFSANNSETALLLAAIILLCGLGSLLFGIFLAIEAAILAGYDSR